MSIVEPLDTLTKRERVARERPQLSVPTGRAL